MDNNIAAQIYDDSTLSDRLVWDDKYRTSEMLQQVMDNRHKATKPLHIEKIGWFLFSFTQTENGCSIARTKPVARFICRMLLSDLSAQQPVRYLGLTINNITANNPAGQRLFSTPKAVTAIISALNKYATAANSVRNLGCAIGNITSNNPEGQRLFSTHEAVAAIIHALNKYATTPDSVEHVGYAIGSIAANNLQGQLLLSTPEAVSAIINCLRKRATTPESVEHLGFAVASITYGNPEGQRLFSTHEAVFAIINALINYATTPYSVENLGFVIANIAFENPEGQRHFSTPEVVSAITNALNNYATTPGSAEDLGNAIGFITTNNPEGQRLFSTKESITAIFRRLDEYSREPDSISHLISTVAHIASQAPTNTTKLLATEEFASIIRQILENAHNPSTLCIPLIATSFLHDSLHSLGSESSVTSSVQDAANRLFGDAKLEINSDAAVCAALLANLGDEYAETVCRREILRGIERFAATKMTDNYRFKPQIQNAIDEITSRLVSRFQKWLNVLIRKHQIVGAEEIFSTEIVDILFKQELDEISFLQKSVNFFESLETFPPKSKRY